MIWQTYRFPAVKVVRQYIYLLITILTLCTSCEVSDITPDSYWPRVGQRVEEVERFWGRPDNIETFYEDGLFITTYYYYQQGAYIDFIDNYVDYVGNL